MLEFRYVDSFAPMMMTCIVADVPYEFVNEPENSWLAVLWDVGERDRIIPINI